MSTILILFAAISVALARPDVSHGYSYGRPGGSGAGDDNFIGAAPYPGGQMHGGGSGRGGSLSGGSLSGGSSSFLGGGGGVDSGFGGGIGGGIGGVIGGGIGGGVGGGIGGGFGNGIGNGFGGGGYSGGSASNQKPIVQKYFYLHSAPEENESEQQVRTVQLGRAQKTYRVVFIKAPGAGSRSASIQPIYPKNEEKTVIYVLSQKDGEINIGDIATPAPSVPTKPEVFFIKYKTAEEAAQAQQKIQAQYDRLEGTSKFSDEGIAQVTSVIGESSGGGSRNNDFSGVTKGTYLPPSK